MTAPGEVLGGRYTLLRQAWTTPRGAVWQARDATLDRRVHVLLLDATLAQDRAQRRAFVDEAAQMAALTDPYLAAVYDIGTDPPFVVFEDAGGGRLADRLRAGPLEPALAARIAANVARGIQALEQRGEPVPAVTSDAVLLSSDGRGKLSPLAAPGGADADPRRELAALTVLLFTGDAPAGTRVSKRDVPGPLAELCSRMLAGQTATLNAFVDACGSLTRPEPLREQRRLQPRRRSDLGWLFGVVLIVALAVVAVVVGPSLLSNIDEGSPEPTADATTAPPPGAALDIADISDFDPDGNGEEHANQTGRAIDGDPLSAWTTVGYKQATMGKPGVGLLLDLGSTATLSAIDVQTSLPGWTAEIRVADEEPDVAGDLTTVTSFTAGSQTSVSLRAGTAGRYVLVWITRLANDEGESDFPFRASINELIVRG